MTFSRGSKLFFVRGVYGDLNSFRATAPFVRRFHQWPVNSPHTGPVIHGFDIFFVASLNKRLNKESSCRWTDSPWRSCDVTKRNHFPSSGSIMQTITGRHLDSMHAPMLLIHVDYPTLASHNIDDDLFSPVSTKDWYNVFLRFRGL